MNKYKSVKYIFLMSLLTLIWFNHKYPFYTYKSNGWSVGFNTQKTVFSKPIISPTNFLTASDLNLQLKDEKSNFLADPFYLVEKDSIYLFVENQVFNDNARIDVFVASLVEKKFIYKGIALDEKFHLSYPQVFKEDGKFYMLPEAKRSNQVLLYTTDNFPYDWRVSDTLIKNVRYKDPSYLSFGKKKYLFVTDDELNLYVYESNKLKGEFVNSKSHTKIRGNEARCGGRIFEFQGKIFLPMQNSSKGYGTGISLYSINFVDDEVQLFKEKNMFLEPQENISLFSRGMHHIDIQKINDSYFYVYDGDMKIDETVFNWKRTLKFNLIDLGLY